MTQRGLRGKGIYRPTHKESKEMEKSKTNPNKGTHCLSSYPNLTGKLLCL